MCVHPKANPIIVTRMLNFHPTMKRTSLTGISCHKCIELHDKRHREIVTIIQAIQRLDGDTNAEASPLNDKSRKGRKKNKNRNLVDLGQGTKEADLDQEPDWDDGSSSTLVPEEVKGPKQVWNGDDRKAAREARKAAKNQTRFNVITKEEMDSVQEALHPEIKEAAERVDQVPNGQGLADNDTIDQNIAFNSHTFMYSSLRQGIHEKKIAKANEPRIPAPKTTQEEKAILEPILASLGIRTETAKATKERKNLFAKLRAATVGDLEAFENEQAETMKRMAGYWRYVNRRTYNQMVRNNELWDWATGQKLPEVEEESELETISEEDGSESDMLDGSTPATTPMGSSSPETCYDNDFVLPENGTPISMAPVFGTYGDWEEQQPKTPTRSTFRRTQEKLEEHIKTRTGRINGLYIPELTINTGYPAYPSLPSVLTGASYANNSQEDALKELGHPSGEPPIHALRSPLPHLKVAAKSPASPTSPFDGARDTRFGGTVAHNASPPKLRKGFHDPKPFRDMPSTIPPITTNIYGNLDCELPAPCEAKKKEPVPLQRAVLNLTIAPSIANAAPEPGWQQAKGLKGRANIRAFPPMAKGAAARKFAAANVAAAKAQKTGAGMDYAAMARKASKA